MDLPENDLFSRFKAASAQAKPMSQASKGVKVMTLGAAMEESFPSYSTRQKAYDEVIAPILTKLTRSEDLSTWRMASMLELVEGARNEETPTLNMIESNPRGVVRVDDIHFTFHEDNIGADVAEEWNIQDALPETAKSMRTARKNTITCIGNVNAVSTLAQSIGLEQANIDVLAQELKDEIIRIRRRINYNLLNATEVTFETAGSVPTMGGLLSRSTDYLVNVGGGDLTRSLIQGRVDAIANYTDPQGLGYGTPLLGITNARQLQVLRDIIISEYGGITPTSRVEYEALLKARLEANRVPVQMVFEPMPGPGAIPFITDGQMAAGTTLILDPNRPQLVKLYLGGVSGPYTLQRPTEKLQSKNVTFDLVSLADYLVISRSPPSRSCIIKSLINRQLLELNNSYKTPQKVSFMLYFYQRF